MLPAALFAACALAQQSAPERYPDVPFVPTPADIVEQMLKLANVHKGDIVYDLGCGDGRIVIMAAEKFGANATGVDIDPDRIREARMNAESAGVTDRVKFVQGDLFQAEISPATVVTLYLLPSVNARLMPRLLSELKPGARVVSHSFDMGDWHPDKAIEVNGRKVYLWTIPEKQK